MRKAYTMNTQKLSQNQEGIVSILVTMIIMIVLSLIVTGFAQLARREQREALDRQLSSQAFYAAETGVNDARRAISKPNGYKDDKTTCGPITTTTDPSYPDLSKNVISDDGAISYSCLLITQTLDKTILQIPEGRSKVVPFNAVSGSNPVPVNELNISWTNRDGGAPAPTTAPPNLPPAGAGSGQWGANSVALVRVDILPKPTGVFTSDSLASSMSTFFFYPTRTVGANTATSANSGTIVSADCTSGKCVAIIAGLPSTGYYVRIKPLYNSVRLEMCVERCDGTKKIQGPQAEVDSTGKANDVLKRIKVRINNTSETSNMKDFPEDVVNSKDSICKKMEVYQNFADLGGCTP